MKIPNTKGVEYNGTISCNGVIMWINDENKCVVRINGVDNVPKDANSARCWIHQDEETGSLDIVVENPE